MSLLRDLIERLRALFFRDRMDRELDEELRDHLERERADQARRGSTDPERDARLALGGVTQVREATREARGLRPLDEFSGDIRYAFRSLGRNRGFATTVILVLGVAIAAATAVFSVAERVIFAELAHEDAHELVRVYQRYGETNLGTISVVDIQGIAEHQSSFEAFGALRFAGMTLTGVGPAEQLTVGRATSGFFDALRVRPAFGRVLRASDDDVGAPPVVVVSHALAERLLGGPAAAVGRSLTLDGVAHEVVGVLGPRDTRLAGVRLDAWPAMPLATPERRGPFGYRGIARLRDGVTVEDASRDLARISGILFPIWKAGFQDSTARLTPVPLRESIVGTAGNQVGLFAGAVMLVLLLAIANVATLMLVRASAREQELAVRAALGASRFRLARLVATECVVLAVVSGGAGLALASWSMRFIASVAPNLPRVSEVALGANGVAVALALAIIAGLAVSLGPLSLVVRGARVDGVALAGSATRAGTGRRTNAWRNALVVTEFALALPLLIGAGLLANSFVRLQRVDLGFDPNGLHALEVSLPGSRYGDGTAVAAFWRRLEDLAANETGVVATGLGELLPPDAQGNVNNFRLIDRPPPPGASDPVAPWSAVTNGFFGTLGIRLLDGRLFAAGDSADAPPVVVVSRGWAAKYYPGESALGRQLYSGGCSTCPLTTVIGVVSDVHYAGIENTADAVYVPFAQAGGGGAHLVVRDRRSPAESLRGLRAIVASLDPELAPIDVIVAEQVQGEFADPKRWIAVVGGFALVGAVLAALGIFGLTSFLVRQRRRELGVRLALGAPPRSLTYLIVGGGMRWATLGTVIGLALAALEARWLGALLFGVQPSDPATLVLSAILLMAVAFVACLVPGIRAARLRPLEAIGAE